MDCLDLDPIRGGRESVYKLVDTPSLKLEKRLSEVERDSVAIGDSSPTKQPTIITRHLICLPTTHKPPFTGKNHT